MINDNQVTAIQSTRGFNLIFIHSSLDDAGLTTEQFRVYAHLSRRAGDGICFASNETMANVCRIRTETLTRCLKELERRQMVVRHPRSGFSTVWKLTPHDKWLKAAVEKEIDEITGDPKKGRLSSTPHEQSPPITKGWEVIETKHGVSPRTKGDEGNPIRVSPEGNPLSVMTLPPPPKKGPSPNQIFNDSWCQRFKKHHSFEYDFNGGKDASASARLVKRSKLTIDELLGIAEQAWQKPETKKYYWCNRSHTVAEFATNLNNVRIELSDSNGHSTGEDVPW